MMLPKIILFLITFFLCVIVHLQNLISVSALVLDDNRPDLPLLAREPHELLGSADELGVFFDFHCLTFASSSLRL